MTNARQITVEQALLEAEKATRAAKYSDAIIIYEAILKSRVIGKSNNKWFFWVRLQELSKMEVIDREIEAMISEQHEAEKNLWDKSVANALANSELDNTMKINKNLVN